MMWFAWRRHRSLMLIVLALVVALGAWMALVAHWYDHLPATRVFIGAHDSYVYRDPDVGSRLFRLSYQVEAIRLLLLLLPCLMGLLLGVPLVAGELAEHTNRIAWTQGRSRLRWLATKWLVVGVPMVALATVMTMFDAWWNRHVAGFAFSSFFAQFDPFGPSGGSRLQPVNFSITGVVLVAYSAFAFALGCALGAVIRRISWAVVATLVVYGVAMFGVVNGVRPVLAPQTFVPFNYSAGSTGPSALSTSGAEPWFLGTGSRFTPGSHHSAGGPSASMIVAKCDDELGNPDNCFAIHGVEVGEVLQLDANYWILQEREAGIYLLASVLLLGASVWAVRRWRA